MTPFHRDRCTPRAGGDPPLRRRGLRERASKGERAREREREREKTIKALENHASFLFSSRTKETSTPV
jgi:hypothetical protein